jgi:cell division protein FtsB
MDGSGVDTSGNGNHLSVVATAGSADRFGNPNSALELSADASSMSLPDGPASDLVSEFTWLGWIRFDRIGTEADSIVAKTCCSSNTTTMFYADTYAWDGTHPNYNQIRFFVTAGGGNFGFEHAGPVLQNHTWYHIALVYDGPARTMKVYVNGTLTNSLTNTGAGGINDVPPELNNVDAPFAMGREPGNGPTNSLQGALDDVWWFSRVLTDQEIADIANAQNCAQQVKDLQAQVTSLAAQNGALAAENTTLNQQVQALLSDLTSLTSQVAALSSQNAALTAQVQEVGNLVDRLEQAFRTNFSNPQFAITGGTAADRIQLLINAILALNRGHQEAIYKALGGQ